ncbi:hypothetical protein Q4519_06950 [Motilimonas sp. 1_MG-2023]|uniref:hypothetical protein n=1 Tax=Motilimonas sp. 1_MG-2023 TaxID=3062672 RepID=UPI0026E34C77|nr:hypothetical protein [Motilimonas sp. 1_MG-2023]MDO6525419.1 hypothetical protein [Motilimonas sp. 1_MG-2023]
MTTTKLEKVDGRVEQLLRKSLTSSQRHAVKGATGWDDSNISRFLSGQQGVTIDRIDELFNSVGITLVTRKYLDAMATMCQVGANCECARNGQGECGSHA